jgi:hypothetical protein
MKQTCLDASEAAKDNHALGHRPTSQARLNGPLGELEVMPALNMRKPDAAGSVHSSARELAAWLNFHLDEGAVAGKSLVSARALRLTHTPQMVIRSSPADRALFPDTNQQSYAMGWVVLDHRGLGLLAHGGAMDGQRAQILLVPEKKLGLAVLSNLHQTPMNAALAFTLLEMALDLPRKRDWNAIHKLALERRSKEAAEKQQQRLARRRHGTRPSHELAAYVGTYEHLAFGTIQIKLTRGKLAWCYRDDELPLEHFHHDTFTVSGELPGEADVVFDLDTKGAVRQFSIMGNFNVIFRKKVAISSNQRPLE